MALNPPLIPVAGNGALPYPAPYAGEYICCSRDQCHFKIEGPRQYKFSGAGTVFLTNFRMVFVARKPTQTVHAVELPMLYVDKVSVQQPILGANNLRGVCKPVDAPPNSSEEIPWKLVLTNGGMGTLVPLFFAAAEYTRVSSRHRHYDEASSESATPTKPPSFLQTALLDPSDPTKIYLVKPIGPSPEQPTKPHFPVV